MPPLLPLVTIGTLADPFAPAGPPGRLPSAGLSLSAAGSPGGGGIPGARVNFGVDEGSAGTVARPLDAAPSFFGSASPGVAEDPGPPDFACVSGIN
ncbi:hypothetical protein Ahu01nite_031770 [Winogradskya humida]|uniref:Uncharacterized protein n=1 Tax=Winogradskya humida TaxID=113566 RepID=A0ABQ3ZNA7_9ACTN|nr:hypothetical protein Ahu01nite_031770 [Actinoplanes humidus]